MEDKILTPEEQAQYLIDRYFTLSTIDIKEAKECALLAVELILDSDPLSPHDGEYYENLRDREDQVAQYWKKVKYIISQRAKNNI